MPTNPWTATVVDVQAQPDRVLVMVVFTNGEATLLERVQVEHLSAEAFRASIRARVAALTAAGAWWTTLAQGTLDLTPPPPPDPPAPTADDVALAQFAHDLGALTRTARGLSLGLTTTQDLATLRRALNEQLKAHPSFEALL